MIKLIHGADFHLDRPLRPAWPRTRPPSGGGNSGSSSPAWPGLPGSGRADLVPPLRRPAGRAADLPGDRPGPGPDPGGGSVPGAHFPGQPRPLYGQVPVCRPGLAGQRPYFFHRNSAECGISGAQVRGLGGAPSPPPTGRTTPWRASGPRRRRGGPSWRFSMGRWRARGTTPPISKASIAGSGLDYLALGHIHQCSGLQREGNTFWAYPGCPRGPGL